MATSICFERDILEEYGLCRNGKELAKPLACICLHESFVSSILQPDLAGPDSLFAAEMLYFVLYLCS